MDFHNPHNLVNPEKAGADRPYGIRVTLPKGDTLQNLLGDHWEGFHWYPTREERDEAFEKMAIRHGYYRNSDSPTQVLEKLERN